MKKILFLMITSILIYANDTKYEITPMIGHVSTKQNVNIKNHKTFGVGVSRAMDDECKFDKLELGLLLANGADYENNNGDTTINQLYLNGIKEYKMNNKFNLFALAGLGYERIDDSKLGNESCQFFNYGVGAAYKINDTFSLKFDARHQLKFDGDKNIVYILGLSIPLNSNPTKKKIEEKKENITLKPIVIEEKDNDNDGVVDSKDKCPTTKDGVKVDKNGCEVVIIIDSDNDGIADAEDKCPTTRTGIKVDENGCNVLSTPTSLGVLFETNSDNVRSSDLSKLKEYVDYLKLVPEATIILEAHTDSVGNEKYNLQLSQKRANSLKRIIVEMGIEENRIKAIGYGESKPLVSNDTEENRKLNRRVTARISQ